MSWSIRHQGSPKAVEDLTLAQIVEGLQDGLWEVTDEVKGPDDVTWVPIENHPQLEAVVADIEPPTPPSHEDETRLDMTPLIDVCMVLLIFFILTITQATLVKQLEAANLGPQGVKVVKQGEAEQTMVYLKVTMENGAPVIRLADKIIPEQDLESELSRTVSATRKTDLLLDCDLDVREKVVVAIQDAAKVAGIKRVNVAVPKNLINK
jgi:biopolymer transport protein ExbD